MEYEELPKRREQLSSRCKDITGMSFDKLTAIYPTILKKSDGSILWACKCSCGKYCLRTSSDLKRTNTGHHCDNKIHNLLDQKDHQNKLRYGLNGQINNNLQVINFSHIINKRIFLKCKCLNCGSETIIRKDSFLNGHATSCGCIKSKGESTIKNILDKNNIEYKTEYIFRDLFDKGYLRFDFAIFKEEKLLGLIEFQGEQHTRFSSSGWNNKENFIKLKKCDNMKKEYCQKNNIKIFFINYNDNIELKLKEILDELYCE